jgi:hypothetical protein
VVNSTASAKAVKVRFLEGRNSREVLDFNLYLSAKDVWTAAIIPTDFGLDTAGAGIFTSDKSCTQPTVSSSSANPTKFVNYAYTGSADDKAGSTLDRTREGYVEIIEMGDVTGTTAVNITHVNGVPKNCAGLASASSDTHAGSGGLFGSMTLINVLKGEDFAVDATALAGFSSIPLWHGPGSILPNLANVNPKTSVATVESTVYITDWSGSSNPVDPVSAVLMHNNVYNEFVLDANTHSGTDWVVTMPTKNLYYSGLARTKLFQRNFSASGACDDVVVVQYDREERSIISETSFSPPPPTQTDALCWEANVITLNNTNVLASKNVSSIPTNFENGWLQLSFIAPSPWHRLTGGASLTFNTKTGQTGNLFSTTFYGLPVLGFAAITFENDVLPGAEGPIQSNYGGNLNHKTTRKVDGDDD